MAQRRFMAGTLESRKIFSQLHSIVLQCTIDLDVAPSRVARDCRWAAAPTSRAETRRGQLSQL